MANLCRLTFVVTLLALATLPTRTDEPPSPQQLVEQLAAKSYRQRERAAQQLLNLGTAAVPFLHNGLASTNPEQRARCEELLATLKQSPAEVELALFLYDGQIRNPKLLPGWERFAKVVGHGPNERALFASICPTINQFLQAIDKHPNEAVNLFRTRCTNLQQEMFRNGGFNGQAVAVPIDELAALLFIGGDERLNLQQNASYLFNFFYQEPVRKELLATASGKRLFEQFLRVNAANEPNVLQQAINLCKQLNFNDTIDKVLVPAGKDLLKRTAEGKMPAHSIQSVFTAAQQLNLPETKEVAVKLLGNPRLDTLSKAMALGAIGRFGDKTNVKDVLPLLADKTRLAAGSINNVNYTTEMRDVALFALIRLTDQRFNDYQFAYLKSVPNFNPEHVYPTLCGFSTDAERNAALTRFQRWLDENHKK
jgi:hypothetical protein